MRPILSRAQMRAYDKYAVESCQVPGSILMENAGRGAADVIGRLFPERAARIVIVCGAGNNGGDGFVVARHLLARGRHVHVFLTGESEQVMGDARINHDAYIDLGGRFTPAGEADDFANLAGALATADVVVDAVFGTGLGRPVLSHLARVIDAMNASPAARVSLDLPSGLDADTGAPLGATVIADHTITFAHLKVGLLTPEGARLAGEVHVVDIGVPETIVEHTGDVGKVLDEAAVAAWLVPREANLHKHAAGAVAVIAGSPGKVGAAVLVAEAALRAGAGLSTVCTWEESAQAVEARARETMTARIVRDDIGGSLDRALRGQHAVAIGPGLGLDDDARAAVEHVLGWHGPKVLDADAITCFAGRPEAIARAARGTVVLTPHSGELGRLLGCTGTEVEKDRFGAAREVAAKTGAIVLLKGARTIIAGGEHVFVNVTGNPALATAGSGDVLSGILAALACGMRLDRAAGAAAYVHGRAADLWRAAHGGADRGMLASEIAGHVPFVIGELLAAR